MKAAFDELTITAALSIPLPIVEQPYNIFLTRNDILTDWQNTLVCLSKSEQQRIDRFRFVKDKRRYAISHWFLRNILSRYLRINVGDIEFTKGSMGKPYISGCRNILFNLSHTNTYTAVIVSRCGEVGVDIECQSPKDAGLFPDPLGVTFSGSEQTYLSELSPDMQRLRALQIWTLKEAYLKQIGTGLYKNMNGITCKLDPYSGALAGVEEGDPPVSSALCVGGYSVEDHYLAYVAPYGGGAPRSHYFSLQEGLVEYPKRPQPPTA